MYNNPFMYSAPYLSSNIARPAIARGLLGGIKKINWGGLLSNTQKTLGIINQAIPIVYQVKPMIGNARTMFKIANTLKRNSSKQEETNRRTKPEPIKKQSTIYQEENKPIFFI